jgi:hypothetical protein
MGARRFTWGEPPERHPGESPVTVLVKAIVSNAIRKGATRIEIERPEVDEVTVFYEIDGVLAEDMSPPFGLWRAIIESAMSLTDADGPWVGCEGSFVLEHLGVTNEIRARVGMNELGETLTMRIAKVQPVLN